MLKTKWSLVVLVFGGLLVLPLICDAVKTVKPELVGNVDFSFYGKLVDQNTNPLPNVTISYTVDVMKMFNTRYLAEKIRSTVTTDGQGNFLIQRYGHQLYIHQLRGVPGYEYSHKVNPKTDFNFISNRVRASFVADQTNPFIFTLRKKGMPAYLLEREIIIVDDINKSTYLIDPWINPDGLPGYLPGGEEPKFSQVKRWGDKDLLVEDTFSADGTQYDIEISPIAPGSGIILSDEFLYEAPEMGYQSAVQLSIPTDMMGHKKYLYIKLDEGKFYGRLDVKFRVYSSEKTDPKSAIFIDIWINPHGSRNLEYDKAFQSDENQWRDLLSNLRGCEDFKGVDTIHKEKSTERVKEFGLGSLPDFENVDQFLNELRQLRTEKDKKTPCWWHELKE